MKKSLGFTLAEVLITLAIIGVVAAMTIPSVIVNTNQAEFRTGFKKAVSVVNSVISMNTAVDGESPNDTLDLYTYLQRNMSTTRGGGGDDHTEAELNYAPGNAIFYTTDGIRFQVPKGTKSFVLHETGAAQKFGGGQDDGDSLASGDPQQGKCGSKGVGNAAMGADTTYNPCIIIVDVNGKKKPTPKQLTNGGWDTYVYAKPNDNLIRDIFPIMITDQKAVPFGTVAQRVMYQSGEKKATN